MAAMGASKWMSRGSRREGPNLRAPATARTQGSSDTLQVHWTPVFARGEVHIHVCDPAREGPEYPVKLNDAQSLGCFVRYVLPGVLSRMQKEHEWPNMPRNFVRDKASYMVSPGHQRLSVAFAESLTEAGFSSWLGSVSDTTERLAPRWGDVDLRETVIAHIRRLLDTDYRCASLNETAPRFQDRMNRVAAHLNSPNFRAHCGRGMCGLAKDLRRRCAGVVRQKGSGCPSEG